MVAGGLCVCVEDRVLCVCVWRTASCVEAGEVWRWESSPASGIAVWRTASCSSRI